MELQKEFGIVMYDFGARNYDPAIGRWMNVDPLAEKAPDWTPYRYGFNNPVRYTDPTGMFEENPVFGSDGTYRGNTIEGYTGHVLIYDGDLDFSQMTAHQLEFNSGEDGAMHYDMVRHELSGEAKSKIWTHITSQLEGQQIYDETFSMNSIEGGIQYRENIGGSWGVPRSQLGKGRGNIFGSDRYNYETTVENIQSSVVVHEWYSHLMKGNSDLFKSHRLAFKNVINFKTLWNKTTDDYKEFNMWGLRHYTKEETKRTIVDPPYRRLSNKYNKH